MGEKMIVDPVQSFGKQLPRKKSLYQPKGKSVIEERREKFKKTLAEALKSNT